MRVNYGVNYRVNGAISLSLGRWDKEIPVGTIPVNAHKWCFRDLHACTLTRTPPHTHTFARTGTQTCTCTHTHSHCEERKHAHKRMRAHTHTHARKHMCTRAHAHTRAHACIHTQRHVCVHACKFPHALGRPHAHTAHGQGALASSKFLTSVNGPLWKREAG